MAAQFETNFQVFENSQGCWLEVKPREGELFRRVEYSRADDQGNLRPEVRVAVPSEGRWPTFSEPTLGELRTFGVTAARRAAKEDDLVVREAAEFVVGQLEAARLAVVAALGTRNGEG